MELRIFAEPQEGAVYEQQLAMAKAAESHGFGAFFRSDHLLRIKPGDGAPGPTDSWVTLGAIARETSTVRLGTMVTSATFRLPGPLAVTVAQVDEMSGGRVEIGLGTGWYEAEHRAYGIVLQPGGHLEPADVTLAGAAERELAEETGLDPGHFHLDFGYAFTTAGGDVGRIQESEVTGAGWYPLAEDRARPIAKSFAGVWLRLRITSEK